MDEYIKREDALDAVLFALVATGYQSTAINAIRDVPTADVAPRAELAREIFEELERMMLDGAIGGKYPAKVINPYKYAELKKKYMGESQ